MGLIKSLLFLVWIFVLLGMPSSVIAYTRYSQATMDLYISFVSGTIYRYKKVPASLYQKMRNAISKGKFFNNYIKDHYEFEKVN